MNDPVELLEEATAETSKDISPEASTSALSASNNGSKNSVKAAVKKAAKNAKPRISKKVAKKTAKKVAKKATKKAATGSKQPFPNHAIDECRRVPEALKNFNAGNAWAPPEVASALGIGTSGNFFYLTQSSRDYGLTIGTRESTKIELSELGRKLVYPKNPGEEPAALLAAFFNVPLFKKVYEYYQGENLPEIEFLKNTLKTEFGVDEQHQDKFYKVYQKNLSYLRDKKALGTSPNYPAKSDSNSSSIILGESNNAGSLVAFVAMPFSEKTQNFAPGYFDEVLKHLITPAAVKANFNARTAKKSGSEVIQSTIVNDLDVADLVIVDLTEHNPNVLFELGMRIAFNKPVCLIRAKGTGAIFDIDHMLRVYEYNPCLWASTLAIDVPALTEHIVETWKNKDTERSYLNILRESK